MSRERALAYLQEHQVLTLATSGPDGVWAAAVFYVNDGFDLYFLSAGHTRHASHITKNPRVAGTIQEDYAGWQEIKGIQFEGTVHLLTGTQRKRAIALYWRKYPFLADAGEAIEVALAGVNWYRVVPDRVYFIDNSQGFGHRERVR